MNPLIQVVAADIAARVPAMVHDNPINNATLIANLIAGGVPRSADRDLMDQHARDTNDIAKLLIRIATLERELAAAKLPTVEHVQDIYELTKLNGEVERLERENAELKAEADKAQQYAGELKRYLDLYEQSDSLTTERELRKALIFTGQARDQLRLQAVRLREALNGMSELCGNYFDETALVCARDKEIWALHLKALAKTPAQSASEVIGQTLFLLKRIGEYDRNNQGSIRKEITRLEAICKPS